jgi:U6 snRNA-associated Sm-like protein LSm3
VCVQAYDNHMNLILSDVEETITIVDVDEQAGPGQESVRVSERFKRIRFTRPFQLRGCAA